MTYASETPHRSKAIVGAALLSWIGLLFHNGWDLPHLTPLSPENSGPTLVFIVLFVVWWRWPQSRVTAGLWLFWGVVHLVGGGFISVIPFDFLPFEPEQSLRHYLGHVIYSATQIPLIVLVLRELRGKRSETSV